MQIPFKRKQERSEPQASDIVQVDAAASAGKSSALKRIMAFELGKKSSTHAVGQGARRKGLFSPGVTFVQTAEDAARVKRGGRIVLCGGAIMGSLKSLSPDGYIAQPVRQAVVSGLMTKKKPNPFRIWVRRDVMQALKGRGAYVFLSYDQVLAWLLKHKGNAIVWSGMPYSNERKTKVEQWVFTNGRLESFEERNLPHIDDPEFQTDFGRMILLERKEKPEYKNHEFVVIGDLPLPSAKDFAGILHLGAAPYERPKSFVIEYGYPAHAISEYVLPVSLVLGGVVAYGLVFIDGKVRLDRLREQFTATVAPVQGAYAQGGASISLMQAHADFMALSDHKGRSVAEIKRVLRATAGLGEVVFQAINYNPSEQDESGVPQQKFTLRIAVVPEPKMAALEQAQPIIRRLADELNATVSLVNHTRTSLRGLETGGTFLVLELEGRMPLPAPAPPGGTPQAMEQPVAPPQEPAADAVAQGGEASASSQEPAQQPAGAPPLPAETQAPLPAQGATP